MSSRPGSAAARPAHSRLQAPVRQNPRILGARLSQPKAAPGTEGPFSAVVPKIVRECGARQVTAGKKPVPVRLAIMASRTSLSLSLEGVSKFACRARDFLSSRFAFNLAYP
jgi:hypothetical protein